MGIHSAADLSARLVVNKPIVEAMIAVTGPVANSDFFPIVAHLAPRDRFSSQVAAGVATIYFAPGAALTLLGALPPTTQNITLEPAVTNAPIALRRQGLAILAALQGRRVVAELSVADMSNVALLREWGLTCFAGVDASHLIGVAARLFRRSLARVSMEEARAAWLSPNWVVCADGQQPPTQITAALESLALALQEDAGAALLEHAGKLISEVRGLSSADLADIYALALVGAARARLPDEVLALHKATLKGLPLPPAARLQMNTIAQLALQRASE